MSVSRSASLDLCMTKPWQEIGKRFVALTMQSSKMIFYAVLLFRAVATFFYFFFLKTRSKLSQLYDSGNKCNNSSCCGGGQMNAFNFRNSLSGHNSARHTYKHIHSGRLTECVACSLNGWFVACPTKLPVRLAPANMAPKRMSM